MQRALHGVRRRARPVGGELQDGGGAAQPLRPPVELLAEEGALHPAALPGGEVGELDGEGGSAASSPRTRAAYSAETSRTMIPRDHPSATTWCMDSTRWCRSGAVRRRSARTSGPAARSKGRLASRRTRRATPASSGSAPSSSVSSGTRASGSTTCTGSPSRSANTVRSASCRATTPCSAWRSASTSSAPSKRTALTAL